jgi:hypothetical protein
LSFLVRSQVTTGKVQCPRRRPEFLFVALMNLLRAVVAQGIGDFLPVVPVDDPSDRPMGIDLDWVDDAVDGDAAAQALIFLWREWWQVEERAVTGLGFASSLSVGGHDLVLGWLPVILGTKSFFEKCFCLIRRAYRMETGPQPPLALQPQRNEPRFPIINSQTSSPHKRVLDWAAGSDGLLKSSGLIRFCVKRLRGGHMEAMVATKLHAGLVLTPGPSIIIYIVAQRRGFCKLELPGKWEVRHEEKVARRNQGNALVAACFT